MDTLLLAEQINKEYQKGYPILKDVTFCLNKKEAFGIWGSNGAGKSTLVSILATLEKPDTGRLLYRGEDVIKKPKLFREHAGFVAQDIALYPSLSGYENLSFFADAYQVPKKEKASRITMAAQGVGLTEEIMKKKVYHYSGGMKRRLHIAIALLHQPEILLLDEPDAGVDEESKAVIMQFLKEQKEKGTGIIYIGHDKTEMKELCERIAILKDGRLEEQKG